MSYRLDTSPMARSPRFSSPTARPSIALQFGVPLDVLRHALMRDGQGRPSGPLGTALDLIAKQEGAP